MDCRPVPTGAAQEDWPHDVTISSLHLQFTEHFRPLAEAGNCAHRPVRSTRRCCTGSAAQPTSCCDWECTLVSWYENFLASSVCSFPVRTRAPHFFSQENFVTVIENKIDFFLVGFATDFYSQARWRERQQSACE
jgi:hypothetical protein